MLNTKIVFRSDQYLIIKDVSFFSYIFGFFMFFPSLLGGCFTLMYYSADYTVVLASLVLAIMGFRTLYSTFHTYVVVNKNDQSIVIKRSKLFPSKTNKTEKYQFENISKIIVDQNLERGKYGNVSIYFIRLILKDGSMVNLVDRNKDGFTPHAYQKNKQFKIGVELAEFIGVPVELKQVNANIF